MDTATAGSPTAAGGVTGDPAIAHLCVLAQVTIPDGSPNGVTPLDSTIPTVASLSSMAYQSEWCGSNLGYTKLAVSTSVTCKSDSIQKLSNQMSSFKLLDNHSILGFGRPHRLWHLEVPDSIWTLPRYTDIKRNYHGIHDWGTFSASLLSGQKYADFYILGR